MFIVWDEEKKKFISSYYNHNLYIAIDGCNEIVEVEHDDVNEEGYVSDDKHNNTSAHQYIGKTDINDKKIYADCSIVEFEYTYINNIVHKVIAYFYFDDKDLAYYMKILNNPPCFIDSINGDIKKLQYYGIACDCKNFKVVDTIQENKLGLVG